MWWKLGVLVVVTAGLIFCVIPIRTHAVLFDPDKPAPMPKWTLASMISNLYLTPGAISFIAALIAVAFYVGVRIVRSA